MSDKTGRHFDNIAEKYDEAHRSWASLYRKLAEVLEPAIEDKVVLDVGSGGVFAYTPARARRAIALDISPGMLERARDPAIFRIVGDARDLAPLADKSVDVVIFCFSVHHITGATFAETLSFLERTLAAACRVLRPGGELHIAEPVVKTWLFWVLERLLYRLTRAILARRGASMALFYRLPFLRSRMAAHLGVEASDLEVTSLPLEGRTDLLGGTVPGVLRIPAWMHPAKHLLISGRKQASSARARSEGCLPRGD